MKKKSFFNSFFLFCLLLGGIRVPIYATHIMGADIQWKYLTGDTFLITLKMYRDCRGIPLPSKQQLVVAGDSCNNQPSYTLTPLSYKITDISARCANTSSPCSPTNIQISTSFIAPTEQHEFIYKFYVGKNSSCCWYKITVPICSGCRNLAITTGYAGTDFSTSSWINTCITPRDNGPEFRNVPIVVKCATQDVCFNHGVYDADGDSLSYEAVAPTSNGFYYSPYSFNYPLACYGGNNPNPNIYPVTGFNLNKITGDICFRPVSQQITVLKIEVKEWRRVNGAYQMIGKTCRDMQFIIINSCNNSLPGLLGSNNYEVCAGTKICFTLNSFDADVTDSTTITWNNGIPNAQLTTTNGAQKHSNATFCWQTRDSDETTLPYYFTISVSDNHCPQTGSTTRSYSINVTKKPFYSTSFSKLFCGISSWKASPNMKIDKINSFFKWYEPKPFPITDSNFSFLSDTTELVYQFVSAGKYIVKSSLENAGCIAVKYDTLEISNLVNLQCIPDTSICVSSPDFKLNTKLTCTNIDSRWWGMGVLPDSITFSPKINTSASPQTYKIFCIVSKPDCYRSDSVLITVYPEPKLQLGLPADSFCVLSDSITITASPQWTGSTYFIDSKQITSLTILPSDLGPGWHTVYYHFTIPGGSCSKDTFIKFYLEPVPKVSLDSVGILCADEIRRNGITLCGHTTKPYPIRWINYGGGTLKNSSWTDTLLHYIPSASELSSRKFKIGITSVGSAFCVIDSAFIESTIKTSPSLEPKVKIQSGCVPFTAIFTTTINDTGILSYLWNFGDPLSGKLNSDSNISASHIYKESGEYLVTLTCTNSSGCASQGPTQLSIHAFAIPQADFTSTPTAPEWTTTEDASFEFTDKSKIKSPDHIDQWEWTFGDINGTSALQNPKYKYSTPDFKDTGWYLVKLRVQTSGAMCYDEITKPVYIGPPLSVFIPNAFSPDDQGPSVNNTFAVNATGFRSFTIKIYNRWGEELYTSSNYTSHGWDGTYQNKALPVDVYIYRVIVTDNKNEEYYYNGCIQLIR
jgi:gliding motility-associated-like protein